VLLAIPALVASDVLPVARQIYGSIGPAFYGLRTTLVAYILLALLRIPRPETLKPESGVKALLRATEPLARWAGPTRRNAVYTDPRRSIRGWKRCSGR
jgi:hypothetical protein